MHGTQLVPRAHQRPLELFPAEDEVKVEGARNKELPSGRVAQKGLSKIFLGHGTNGAHR